MRTPDSDCLLCQTNKAVKKNSHIVPKFFVKSIFADAGRAFAIQPNKADQKPSIKQNSPTEDYILCSECEQYIGILEREFANNVYNILIEPAYQELFEDEKTSGQVIRYCRSMNPIIVNLFIQSILWRCAISDHVSFASFKLPHEHEEGLRQSLINYKATELKSFNGLVEGKIQKLYKGIFSLITYYGEFDETKGNFACFPYREPIIMPLNKYILAHSFDENTKQMNFRK